MRSTDNLPTDPLGQLGKAIKPTAAPAPTPQKTSTPGVLRGADGKLQTDLPEPSWAAPSCLAEKPADPEPASAMSAEELAGMADANAVLADWLGW